MSQTGAMIQNWLRRAANQPDMAKRLARIGQGGGAVLLDHLDEATHAFMLSALCEIAAVRGKSRIWIVCDSPRHRERLAAEMELFGTQAHLIPEATDTGGESQIRDPESVAEWLTILEILLNQTCFTVLCSSESFDIPVPSAERIRRSRSLLEVGMELDPQEFSSQLTECGHERVPTVSARGQFAVKGGIIDLFPWQSPTPIRLEFFDLTLESIREFDMNSQVSIRKINSCHVILEEPTNNGQLADYRLADDWLIEVGSENFEADVRILELPDQARDHDESQLAGYGSPLGNFEAGDFVLAELRREQFFRQINEWRRDEWEIAMVFANRGEQDRFSELLAMDLDRDMGISPILGHLQSGFTLPFIKLAVLSSAELFGRYRSPERPRRNALERVRQTSSISDALDVNEGELVVHYEYGLAKYRGIHLTEEGEELHLEYKDGVILGVPLEQAHLVGRYIGVGSKAPTLSKLGTSTWKNARNAAEKSILDYAAQMLRIQAEREHTPGYAHPPDSKWMQEFEQSFHFTETPDQKSAIDETKQDLEAARPMDRLICGDVGYGKTEVAIRAV
ncbi:MAG: CarD family transcriptional regulator, partial [Luteolibacter sp.]